MSDVTRVLSLIEQGDPVAAERLLPLVYGELRKLAAARLAQEQPGQTLQATALVHEAYLRLVGDHQTEPSPCWESRGHFFAAASEAMRRILVDIARRKRSQKQGGDFNRVELSDMPAPEEIEEVDLLALDEALSGLETVHPAKAAVVKLRFFAGCTLDETAQHLGISRATAERHWAFARAWLFGRLSRDEPAKESSSSEPAG